MSDKKAMESDEESPPSPPPPNVPPPCLPPPLPAVNIFNCLFLMILSYILEAQEKHSTTTSTSYEYARKYIRRSTFRSRK